MTDAFVGDIGTRLEVNFTEAGAPLSLAEALAIVVLIERKDKTTVAKVPDPSGIEPDGTTGLVRVLSVLGDFTIKGAYKIQGYARFATGNWYTDIGTFEVADHIVVPAGTPQ